MMGEWGGQQEITDAWRLCFITQNPDLMQTGVCGAKAQTRTGDPCIFSALLYQLSYLGACG